MNTAKVSTLLDVVLSRGGLKGNKTDAADPGKGRPMNWDNPDLRSQWVVRVKFSLSRAVRLHPLAGGTERVLGAAGRVSRSPPRYRSASLASQDRSEDAGTF